MLNFTTEITNQILDAHQKHGHLLLYRMRNCSVVCRLLSIGELETVAKLSSHFLEHRINEWIFDKVVIHNSVGDNILAGYVSVIARSVMKRSAAVEETDLEDEVKKGRQSINSAASVIESLVYESFGSVTPDYFKGLNQKQQIKWLALAEQASGKQLNIGLEKGKKGRPLGKLPGYNSIGGEQNSDADWILSKEAADKPDFEKDNAALRGI